MQPLGPLNVELNGNLNLFEAAKRAGCKRVVLVSSIGADDLVNPLNLFWGVLLFKKQVRGVAPSLVRLRHAFGQNGHGLWRGLTAPVGLQC
jgi:uncharacterized protein YbjT (DUF2867 family)